MSNKNHEDIIAGFRTTIEQLIEDIVEFSKKINLSLEGQEKNETGKEAD